MRPVRILSLVLSLAALALFATGCAWGSVGGLSAALVLALAFVAACSGSDVFTTETTSSDAGSEGSTPSQDAGLCGTGRCPAAMTCVSTAKGPWCLPDADRDGVVDQQDNCPYAANAVQTDSDQDGLGDACDLCAGPNDKVSCGIECCSDPDGDGVPGTVPYGLSEGKDNCPYLANKDQLDVDKDGVGDACDLCGDQISNPATPCGDPCFDTDGDGIVDGSCASTIRDNCPKTASPLTTDVNNNGTGDVCDPEGIAPLAEEAGTAARTSPTQDRIARRRALLLRLHQEGVIDRQSLALALQAC